MHTAAEQWDCILDAAAEEEHEQEQEPEPQAAGPSGIGTRGRSGSRRKEAAAVGVRRNEPALSDEQTRLNLNLNRAGMRCTT